jgi:hypothetical protein
MKILIHCFVISVCAGLIGAEENGNINVAAEQDVGIIRSANAKCADMLETLSLELKTSDSTLKKLKIIRKIGAIRDAKAKEIMLEYFNSIPPPILSDHSDQSFKIEVSRTLLPMLEKEEEIRFLAGIIQNEVDALKAAKLSKSDSYYPKDLLLTALEVCETGGAMSAKTRAMLADMASDDTVPPETRSAFLASVVRYDLAQDGSKTLAEKARSIVDTIPVRPAAPFPWEVYNDKQKRIAYGKSETYLREYRKSVEWRKSKVSIQTEAYERVLESYGFVAVEQLVAALGQKNVSKERRDYFARLAAEVLSKLSSVSAAEYVTVNKLISVLETYIDEMQDLGAFCNRNIAIRKMYLFYKNTGFSKQVPFKEGGSVYATIMASFTNAVPVTDNVSLSQVSLTNSIVRNDTIKASKTTRKPVSGCWFIFGSAMCVLLFMWLFVKLRKS